MGAVGAGALMGAYTLSRIHERHLTLAPILSSLSFGVFLIAFAHSTWLPLSMLLLLPTAFSLMLLGGSTNTIIQTVASDHMRGRVVAFYAMFFMGMMPWGSLLLGWIGEHFGVTDAISIGGLCVIASAALAWFNWRETRPHPAPA
jgi:predicted MFS family arabinose efflux permease